MADVDDVEMLVLSSDANPRPFKRVRLSPDTAPSLTIKLPAKSPTDSTASPDGLSASPSKSSKNRIPPPVLLLNMPRILLTPPDHPDFAHSLHVSLISIRKCIHASSGIDVEFEARARISLVEVGMRVIQSGLEDANWARSIRTEIEKTITKLLALTKSQPTLAEYYYQAVYLNAEYSRLPTTKGNSKSRNRVAKGILTRFLSSSTSIPAVNIYMAHLQLVSIAEDTSQQEHKIAVTNLRREAFKRGDSINIGLLCDVLESRYNSEASVRAEASFRLHELGNAKASDTIKQKTFFIDNKIAAWLQEEPWKGPLLAQLLVTTVSKATMRGDHDAAWQRAVALNSVMDCLESADEPELSQVPLLEGSVLEVLGVRQSLLRPLVQLIVANSKRDPTGSSTAKRRLFATEAIRECNELISKGFELETWSTTQDLISARRLINWIKAANLSEVVGVCILRSELVEARAQLNELVAHCHAHDLWTSDDPSSFVFAPLAALHHAHIAHLAGDSKTADQCYNIAAGETAGANGAAGWINRCATIGSIALQIGQLANDNKSMNPSVVSTVEAYLDGCIRLGNTCGPAARVVRACLTEEILTAKEHLKAALVTTTTSRDESLRALIFALSGSFYITTGADHALYMLNSAKGLLKNMGGVNVSPPGRQLDRWVDDRIGEIHQRRETVEQTEARAPPSSATDVTLVDDLVPSLESVKIPPRQVAPTNSSSPHKSPTLALPRPITPPPPSSPPKKVFSTPISLTPRVKMARVTPSPKQVASKLATPPRNAQLLASFTLSPLTDDEEEEELMAASSSPIRSFVTKRAPPLPLPRYSPSITSDVHSSSEGDDDDDLSDYCASD